MLGLKMKIDIFYRINEIRNKLSDDISKVIFEARLSYLFEGDRDNFIEKIEPYIDNMYCGEISQNIARTKTKGIIIYGCGYEGLYDKKVVELCGYKVSFFCDSYNYGIEKNGVKVISPDEVAEKYKDYLVIIGSPKYVIDMRNTLIDKGFPADNIVYPAEGTLLANGLNQYFEVLEPSINEIFVDAGAYDGYTSVGFKNWAKKGYDSIKIFEPMREQCKKIERLCEEEKMHNVDIYANAVWNKKESLKFSYNGTASRINPRDGEMVECIDIDSVIDNVTFIKMDVEGAEYKALEGAEKVIKECKPKLAISVYHKPVDIVEIPLLIMDMVPEYKFWLRHYSTNVYETVLYAVCE